MNVVSVYYCFVCSGKFSLTGEMELRVRLNEGLRGLCSLGAPVMREGRQAGNEQTHKKRLGSLSCCDKREKGGVDRTE